MQILDFLDECTSNILREKRRNTVTSFGIFWGAFMLILLLGIGDGLEKGIYNSFRFYSTNSIHVYPDKTKIPINGIAAGTQIQLTNSDYEDVINKFGSSIKLAAVRSFMNSPVTVKYNNVIENYTLYGCSEQLYKIRSLEIKNGRFISKSDIEDKRKVVVIGHALVHDLFRNLDPVGKHIEINNQSFQVIGSFKSFKDGELGEKDNRQIYVPYTTHQYLFNKLSHIDNFSFIPLIDANKLENNIVQYLLRIKGLDSKDLTAFYSWNTQEEQEKFDSLFITIRFFVWFVSICTLLSGIVGITNMMLISINERRTEIGIRKVVGATPSSLMKMMTFECTAIVTLSGYLGIAISLGIVFALNIIMSQTSLGSFFFSPPEIQLEIVLYTILILFLAGLGSSYLPCRKIMRINPIDTINSK